MSGYWKPSDVGFDPADYITGQTPIKDDETGLFVPGATAGPGTPTGSILLIAPDGTVWSVTVDNTGTLAVTAAAALLTEGGDTLVTEAGDRLLLEA